MNYFTDSELLYSAHAQCPCGAGLAYPHRATKEQIEEWQPDSVFVNWDHWDCSDILTGRAIKKDEPGSKQHCDKLSFAFYEIKSENQPSARGDTTRRKSS
jgi:hypothetical protein